MGLNINNAEVERLAAEIAEITGESKTEAVRVALTERRERLAHQLASRPKGASFLRFLQEEVWPRIPDEELGRRLTRCEEEEILGLHDPADPVLEWDEVRAAILDNEVE